jgi:FMN phosphatase YigB (HAD superfamily)
MRSSSSSHCDTLILDLGDVLFSWSPKTPTTIPPKVLQSITASVPWGLYECGKLSQSECYRRVAQEYALEPNDVALAFQHARDSLQADNSLLSFIRQLKKDTGNKLRVFAMSNVSEPDFQFLKARQADWTVFDQVFTSAAAGARKPNLAYYTHVLEAIGGDPRSMVFVDDKPENVLAARSLGMHGIVFDKTTVRPKLRCLVCDPIIRGQEFLNTNAGKLDSITNTGVLFGDNFAQLNIFEVTRDR